MGGGLTVADKKAVALEGAAEELVIVVGERDKDAVAAALHHSDPAALAVILAELLHNERGLAGVAETRHQKALEAKEAEVVKAAHASGRRIETMAAKLETMRAERAAAKAETRATNKLVWGRGAGVKPAGMSVERAAEIAQQSAERRAQ